MEESSNPSSIVSQPNEYVVLGGYVQDPQMEEHTDPSSMISQPSDISALKQVIESTLECSLCLSMICEPISISCGHSFCRTCLVKSLRRHKKKCPSCRAICHVMAETAEENIIIKGVAMTINPDGYSARLVECMAERSSWARVYPIFYYNDVKFPGSPLCLHLFEPRYRVMMQRVVNTTRAFAYVPNFTNYSAEIGDIALIASINEIEFMADGRCMVDATLTGRHRIVDHYVEDGTQGLHFCSLEEFRDAPLDEESRATAQALRDQSMAMLSAFSGGALLAHLEQRNGRVPSDIEAFSLWLTGGAAIIDEGKVQLLACTDTLFRLRAVVDSFTRATQQFSRSQPRSRGPPAAATAAGAAAVGAGGAAASADLTLPPLPPSGSRTVEDEEDDDDDDDDDEQFSGMPYDDDEEDDDDFCEDCQGCPEEEEEESFEGGGDEDGEGGGGVDQDGNPEED